MDGLWDDRDAVLYRTPEQDLCGRLAILRGDIPHDRFDKHLVRLSLSQRRIGHMRDAVFFFPRVICLPLTIKMCLDLIDSRLDLIVGDQVHEPVRLKVRYTDGADRSRAIERFQFPPRAVIIRERPVQQHKVEIVRSQQPHRLFHRFSCVIVGLEIDLRNKKQFLAVNAAASDAIARRMGAGMKIVVGDKKLANAQAIAGTMNEAGFDVTPVEMDLSSRGSIQVFIAEGQKYGEIKMLVNAAGVSPSQAPIEAILKVDLYGTAVLLEEVGKVIAQGGVGVTISSQSGWRMPTLTVEQDLLLATTLTKELLKLDFLQPENIRDTLHAYQMVKRCNEKRVMAQAVE